MLVKIQLLRSNGSCVAENAFDLSIHSSEFNEEYKRPIILEDGNLLDRIEIRARIYQMAENKMTGKEIEDTKLKVGDVVQLKSGGPAMVINGVGPNDVATCMWQLNGEPKQFNYYLSTLRLYKDERSRL